MFASDRGFSGSGYRMVSVKFYSARPPLPWQRNLGQDGKTGYNSACIRDIPEIFAYNMGFSGSGY